MGFFDIFRRVDINEGVKGYKAAEGAVLIDVRTLSEYAGGHIEGSVNIPLQSISGSKALPEDRCAPIYVYCLSGARSRQAVHILKRNGYASVNDIGGIADYKGKVVR